MKVYIVVVVPLELSCWEVKDQTCFMDAIIQPPVTIVMEKIIIKAILIFLIPTLKSWLNNFEDVEKGWSWFGSLWTPASITQDSHEDYSVSDMSFIRFIL